MKRSKKPWGWVMLNVLIQSNLALVVLSSFFNALKKFDILSSEASRICSLVAFVISFAGIAALSLLSLCRDKKSKFVNWVNMNYASIALFNIMLISFFTSIQNEAVWTHEQLKDIVSMQWTIFGFSITIFLVWHAIVFTYFKNKRPTFLQATPDLSSKLINLEKKTLYYRSTSLKYSTTSYLGINFLLLYLVTQVVFLHAYPNQSIFFENLLRFSFCFSLLTLLKLLADFFEPINEQKKELLKDMTVTNHDIDVYNSSIEQLKAISAVLSEISSTDTLSNEEKKATATALLKLLSDDSSSKQQN